MSRLAERTGRVERSAIRAMFDRAAAAEAAGRDVVHLEIGEPDFDTPEHVVRAACEAAEAGETHYTSNAGLPELREAVADRLADRHGIDADPEEEVVITTGAMEALYLAMAAVVDPGEEVLVPTPAWPNYDTQAKLVGADPVAVPLDAERGFALDADRLVEAMGPATAAVVLTTPSNPTGQVYDRDAVREVVAAAADHDAFVIADEVYSDLTYGDHPTGVAAYTDHPERVLTVESCSKSYAMTGWRVGWLAGPDDVVGAATMLRESTTACTPSVSQHAAIAALTGPQEPVEEMAAAFEARRDYVAERVAAMAGADCPTPEGAFYAFLDVSALGEPSVAVAERLLDEYGVVVAPGSGFGDAGEGHLRLSFANSRERLAEGLDRIGALLADELDR
ncbi:MAG: pyridoxal phosphate-dependent aminotransferase [Halobacteriaceae archaeon]